MNKPSFTNKPERPVAPKSMPKVCEHKYQVLDKQITNVYADSKPAIRNISATFYCEKCLAITHKSLGG